MSHSDPVISARRRVRRPGRHDAATVEASFRQESNVKRIPRTLAVLALTAVPMAGALGVAGQAGAATIKNPAATTTVTAKPKVPTATANLTIDASSFAYSICGDNAFEDGSEPGTAHIIVQYQDGYGPFGGGSYDCATGELTI